MTAAFVLSVAIGVALALEFLAALACYSLRGFSRSRLDEVCRERGDEERFGVILRQAISALLVAEVLFALTSIGLVALLFYGLDFGTPPGAGPAGWSVYSLKLLSTIAAFLLVAVIVPWSAARVIGEVYIFRIWPLVKLSLVALAPLVSLSRLVDKFAHRMGGLQEPAEGDAATITEEILTVVDEGQREGLLEIGAGTMIHRVMDMAQEDVDAVMTPRTDMVCIHVDSPLEEAREKLLEAGHSRVPIIGESPDDIVGVLYAKDLLKHMHDANGQAVGLREIVREPIYVPETTPIDKMLETMKRDRVQMAIVLDEYGGTAGLVTMEDILEEIVGEIVDEYDAAEEEGILQVGPGVHEVDARVHIDDLNEQFEFDLPEDGDFDTIGGFTFTQLGRIPHTNESFTWGQLRFTVLDADKRKINKLRIEVDPTLAVANVEEQ